MLAIVPVANRPRHPRLRVPLAFQPPTLASPTTLTVADADSRNLNLSAGQDYIIRITQPLTSVVGGQGGIRVVGNGARHVVLIGGEINIAAGRTTLGERRALSFEGITGTVHVEGFYAYGAGLTEGIQFYDVGVAQVCNTRIDELVATDMAGFTDNHPDAIQLLKAGTQLKVDGLTARTTYQGILALSTDPQPCGPMELHRCQLIGRDDQLNNLHRGYLLNNSDTVPLTVGTDCWVTTRADRPDLAYFANGQSSTAAGINLGARSAGDVVLASMVGMNYAPRGFRF